MSDDLELKCPLCGKNFVLPNDAQVLRSCQECERKAEKDSILDDGSGFEKFVSDCW